MIWANSQMQFNDSAKAEFSRAENADAWVIGFAVAKEYVVVTHEQLDPAIRRRVPIPNVCEEFDVEFVDTFQMLRSLGVRLS
jgi:hypothetical protein